MNNKINSGKSNKTDKVNSRLFGLFSLAAILILFCSCEADNLNYDEAAFETELTVLSDTELQSQVFKLVNQYRDSLGLIPLLEGNYAATLAQEHNDYMLEKGLLSHDNFNERVMAIVNETHADEVSENVGKDKKSPEKIIAKWLKSTAHKEAIEGDYTHSGISAKTDSVGNTYYTQIFYRLSIQ